MLTSNNVTYFFGLIHFSAAKIFLYKLKGESHFTKTEGLPSFFFYIEIDRKKEVKEADLELYRKCHGAQLRAIQTSV